MKNIMATSQQGSAGGAASAELTHEVSRLISAGKCKQAVELAKDAHKRLNSPDSEKLVVDAYVARIGQFQQKGATEDAQRLLQLVRERFPSHYRRFQGLHIQTAVSSGNLDGLLAPLATGNVPEETRASIETAIRQQLIDLGPLATCASLPADHPLRMAAAATWKAFAAVTTGPVTEQQIELPEVSRRSPLAGWKMLIRAIAAFYKHDDDRCRHALEAIPEDAAARRLAGVLLAMLEGNPPGGGMAGVLQARVCADARPLREALLGIERALASVDPDLLCRQIREALRACSATFPELAARMGQRIFVRCVLAGVPAWDLDRILAAPTQDAPFWRLMARTDERRGRFWDAAMAWDKFQAGAVREGILQAGTEEQAVVFQHAGELLSRLSPRELVDARENHRATLAAMEPAPTRRGERIARESERLVMDAGSYFARAAGIAPDAQTFKLWWKWADGSGLPDNRKEDVAKAWRHGLPGDPEPCLILSELTEKRNALKMAIGHLEDAEAIDPLDPRVRRARLRITMGILWRHLKDRKPHLVEKDLAELEALPAMTEKDHRAFLSLLRAAWHVLRKEQPEAARAIAVATEQLGSLAVTALNLSINHGAKLRDCESWPPTEQGGPPDPRAVAEAYGRTLRLAEALTIPLWRPTTWDPVVEAYIREHGTAMTHADLLAIGRASHLNGISRVAYLASAGGLASATGPTAARFLALRARSLPEWADGRISQCLRAAMELAETAHDETLMKEIMGQIERHPPTRQARTRSGSSGRNLGSELLAEIIKSERLAAAYPATIALADKYLVAIETDAPPIGPMDFGAAFDYEDDEEDDDDYDEYDDSDDLHDRAKGMPTQLPQEVWEIGRQIIEKFGHVPSPDELMRRHPFLAMKLVMALGGADFNPQMLDALGRELMNGPAAGIGKSKKKRGR